MSGRFRSCSDYQRRVLSEAWELGVAGSVPSDPAEPWPPAGILWSRAVVPGTVAASLRESGRWSLDAPPRRFDAEEWWYRVRFSAAPAVAGERVILGFDGLATFAEVRLNGRPLIHSDNMFVEHRCDVSSALQADNELVIRFSSVDAFLNVRRGRPRWRTPMVQHQQLRWVRTSLLGRTPGWSPPAAPVGPWRPVWLERRRLLDLGEPHLEASVLDGSGRLSLSCAVSALGGATLKSAQLIAARAGRSFESTPSIHAGARGVQGELSIPNVELWWPHTHGEPALYEVSLRLRVDDAEGGERVMEMGLGSVGFRTLRLDREAGRFAFHVNGRELFARGASWTPLDCVSLNASGGDYRAAFERVRDAGMNMLRVPGPMVYENDEFLDLCDSTGILLWQDFMFANMDYPAEDAAFAASAQTEVRQQLSRLQARPALAMLCGNSEGAQQAAMSGAARACWSPAFFEVEIAKLAARACPDVPYCPSSTDGGAFPFQPGIGVTSYYGVGAYLRPLSDARRSEVRFASECLAFANVPEGETLELLAQDHALRCHHPRWKERVPRDLGAGWDFDDVRDHYLSLLYAVDPSVLRSTDHDRYLRLSRAASGEVMAATFAEWRRPQSACRGALVWFLGDLWPGAGWGVIDSNGQPKAAYYYLKRVLQPLALFISDEGSNGLMIHIVNDRPIGQRVRLQLQQFRCSRPVGGAVCRVLDLAAASALTLAATDLYEGFVDLSYAFRFGPAPFDVLQATLTCEQDGAELAEAFYFPQGLPHVAAADIGLTAEAAALAEGVFRLSIRCKDFAQSVHADVPGFIADDQYFHMAPNTTRSLILRRRAVPSASPGASLEGTVHALNAVAACRISRGA